MEPKYKFSIDPTPWDVFIASHLAVLMRPLRIVFIYILYFLLLILVTLAATNLQELNAISILFCMTILCVLAGVMVVAAIELSFVINILLRRKALLAHVDTEFTDTELISHRTEIETKIKYTAINRIKVFGDYMFLKINNVNSLCYLPIKDPQIMREVEKFLLEKKQSDLSK